MGIWNFIGAGVFGFLINLPIISYFEIGTNLTPNHGHAAMFGVFGMLAIAVSLFCMRFIQTEQIWEKIKNLVKVGFWGLNIGLALMVIIDLFPSGLLLLCCPTMSFVFCLCFCLLRCVRVGPEVVTFLYSSFRHGQTIWVFFLDRRPIQYCIIHYISWHTPYLNSHRSNCVVNRHRWSRCPVMDRKFWASSWLCPVSVIKIFSFIDQSI